MDSQDRNKGRGKFYPKKDGGGRGQGRGRGWANQGGHPPDRGPPQSGGGSGSYGGQQRSGGGQGAYGGQQRSGGGPGSYSGQPRSGGYGDQPSPPQRYQDSYRPVSPGQGPPGGQQFVRFSGPAPFAPRNAPPPFSRPEHQQTAMEPSKPAWGMQAASPIDAPSQTDLSKQIEKFSISQAKFTIPRRPHGQAIQHRPQFFGKSITLEVNYLPINFKDLNLKIFHYDVTFNPDRPKSLYRQALGLLMKKHVPNRHPAFDGKKNMYAAGSKLPLKGDVLRDSIKVYDPERGKEAEFDITVKLVDQDLSLSKLATYMRSGTSMDIPQDVIQGIDIALRNAPSMNTNFVPVGRSFFAIPRQEPTYLGMGMELWHGHYQSAIMAWKPYLNVDVANKAFPAPQSVLNFMYHDMNLDPKKPMERGARYQLLKFLKGLKVDYNTRPNEPTAKRTYKVFDLGDPPSQHRFKPDKEGSREITVEQYFRDIKKIPLQYPHLPTIVATNKSNLPLEFCSITPNQAVMRKLDDKQTAVMVKSAAKGTDIRKSRIMNTINQCYFNQDPCAKEFKMEMSTNFEKVEAQMLKPPMICYKDNRTVTPRNGVWQTRQGEQFIDSPGLHSWVIINTDRKINQPQINNLVKNFKDTGRNIGIDVRDPKTWVSINVRSEADFEMEFKKYKDVQILVVIMSPFVEDIYSKIKRAAELKVGVLTQCIKSFTCDNRKMNPMTAQNILLKINSKISGINHNLAPQILPRILRDEAVMVVGADVTHPAPGSDGISIAAVAASHDLSGFKYNMLYRLQPGRQEMIINLQDMIMQQLNFFLKSTGRRPQRILYYRDGVSEGQFLQVLNVELQAIRAACTKLSPNYQPAVTFLVVQKRHHTRFFPGPRDWDGDRNKNVLAGTLVDTGITHPTEIDFYLVSHQSIQGTARPTKYHLLWDDNNIAQDELEQVTYYLCHMFARCNRSVSYPAPTYYAHLAAFRARAWWDGQRYDALNLAGDQERNGRIQDHIVNNTPMFFV